jgi:hypothetical protein
MTSTFERYLPYTGALAGVLFAINGFVAQTSDKVADPQAVQVMRDHATQNVIAAVAGGLFCVAMVFFAGALRAALRSGEGAESTYSSIAFGGALLVASTKAVDGWLLMAGGDAADRGDKASLQTLSYLGIDSWMPWAAASAVFFLATGLGGLRTAALPRWLAITAVVLGVLCLLGPTGIAVWFATPVWLVLAGVLLGRRAPRRREQPIPVTV